MAVDEFLVIKILHAQICSNSIIGVNIQKVLDSSSLRSFVAFRYFVNLQPVTLTFLCKEQHSVMHCGRIDMFNEVLITGFATL